MDVGGFRDQRQNLRFEPKSGLANRLKKRTQPWGACFFGRMSQGFEIDARFAIRTQIWLARRFEKTNPTAGEHAFADG
jgi:hypothetical protein